MMPEIEEQDHGTIRVDGQGRLVLPRPVRELLGLAAGSTLHYRASSDGRLELRTRQAMLAELRAIGAPLRTAGYGVEQFLADKHEEAEREEQDVQAWLTSRRSS